MVLVPFRAGWSRSSQYLLPILPLLLGLISPSLVSQIQRIPTQTPQRRPFPRSSSPLVASLSSSLLLLYPPQFPIVPSAHFIAPLRNISAYSEYKKLHATLPVVELEALKDRLRRGDERSIRKIWEGRKSNFVSLDDIQSLEKSEGCGTLQRQKEERREEERRTRRRERKFGVELISFNF